jgi:hypothetical protein
MKCPQCGSEAKTSVEGPTLLLSCAHCGAELATTYQDPIKLDQQVYTIVLLENHSPSRAALKEVASCLGASYARAKEALVAGAPVFEGKAVAVKSWAQKLKEAGVVYRIDPRFPYC